MVTRALFRKYAATLCLALMGGAFGTAAAGPGDIAGVDEQTLDRLANHPEWRRLLHAPVDGTGRSAVADDRFFLASNGHSNPKAELLATLEQFQRSEDFSEDSPNCRFVARRQWLAEQLHRDDWADPNALCDLYREWREMIRAGRATLVFPGYHLNSPSSMFGHTLLRIDPPEEEGWTDWLGFSVSFGADIRNQDNSILYAWKGLTGGYPGKFIVTPYFEKIREYSKIDNRDIWEYPLNLSAEEVDRLVTHLWELKDINFAYYFFDENCSYRLLELLEVARPGLDLTSEFVLTAIPVDTIRSVTAAGLTEAPEYRPSRVARLRARIDNLPEGQVANLQRVSSDPDFAKAAWYQQLLPETRGRLVDAAYEHHSYRNRKKYSTLAIAGSSHAMLSELSKLEVPPAPEVPAPAPPDAAHDSKRLRIGVGEVNERSAAQLGFRMSFHKLEDRPVGFLKGAQINLFSADFSVIDDSLRVERLDFVDILSLTDWSALFPDVSWGVTAGLDRVHVLPGRPLVPQVEGGGGMSRKFGDDLILFGQARARLDRVADGVDDGWRVMAGPMAGALWTSASFSLLTTVESLAVSTGHAWHRGRAAAAWHLARNVSLRLEWQAQRDQRFPRYERWGLATEWYFP